jgi:Protein of unknown function (DUF1698)
MQIPNRYVAGPPSAQQALDLFDGEWSSQMPSGSGLRTRPGSAALFEDARINWLSELLGGFAGRSVLELGPLEGGHSYMMQRGGADRIVSVEANTRAYLKCLCVKEIFGLNKVQFLLGDFVEYLRSSDERFDVVLASGVLYHMQEPVELLQLAARKAPVLMLWTHFYDAAVVRATQPAAKFGAIEPRSFDGLAYEAAEQRYFEALEWAGFCGGPAMTSRWMTKPSILDVLDRLGFTTVVTGFEQIDHPNGPAFALFARR